MIGRFWHRAPWWIAGGVASLALFHFQFSVAGKALTLVAIVIGLAGVLVAPLADAMLLAIAMSLLPGDVALFGMTLGLLYRATRSRSLGFDGSLRSMLLFGFFVSVVGSALFGVMALVTCGCAVYLVTRRTFSAGLLREGQVLPEVAHDVVDGVGQY